MDEQHVVMDGGQHAVQEAQPAPATAAPAQAAPAAAQPQPARVNPWAGGVYAAYGALPDANLGKERLEQGLYIVREVEQASKVEGKPGPIDHPVEMLAALAECLDASLDLAVKNGDHVAVQTLTETLGMT